MKLRLKALSIFAMLVLWPASASAQCQLCTAPGSSTRISSADRAATLQVEVETQLDFSRVATGAMGGEVALDPVTGARRLQGDLVDLGGFALTGVVHVRGTPGAELRVTLPSVIHLVGDNGKEARVVGLATDLTAAPRLGPDGSLRFRFGGRLQVSSSDDGDYRGRIPIVVEYQ